MSVGLDPSCHLCLTFVYLGIAVGAGELEEDTAKEFAELNTEFEKTKRELSEVQEENKKLRARLVNLGQSQND